ncbi:hypothetical protein JL721_5056 [Aureococcus anophagefferens]|nr:hypothetical protein JL721_5056 [Aureococcus anophagefferens]
MAPSRMDIVPEKIVMFTDAGTDLDDEMAMIFARYLIEFNFIDLLGVVSVLHPSFKRAARAGHHGHDRPPRRARGLRTDGGDAAGRNEAPDAASPPGAAVIASLKDAALFLRDNEALFAAKVKEVSIMGGVTAASVDRGGLLEPDTAHNNVFDATAAAFFYRRCQELGVRLVIVGRDAAYQIVVTMQVQPNKADEFMGLALLRALIELQAVDLLGIVLTPRSGSGEHASKRACQLEELYARAPQTGVRLVVIHSQTDAADFASRSPELFREKTLGAVVMGGVVATGLGVEDDGVVPCAALVPDADASNNRADEVAATFFTARCQALGVPMTVISRHLALACRLPRSVYDALGARGGPVGASVCDAQRPIEHLRTRARDVTELRLFLCRLIFKGVLMNASHFPDDLPSFAIDGAGTVDPTTRSDASTSTTSASSRSRNHPKTISRASRLKSPK